MLNIVLSILVLLLFLVCLLQSEEEIIQLTQIIGYTNRQQLTETT